MKSVVRCVYCDKCEKDGIRINESDIIPDGLTNRRILLKRVCSEDHNSKFSDKFETKVIETFERLRNKLEIRNKNNVIPSYTARLKVGDVYIKSKILSKEHFLNGKIRKGSLDGKPVLIGSEEVIRTSFKSKPDGIEVFDINDVEMIEDVGLQGCRGAETNWKATGIVPLFSMCVRT